MAYKILYIEDSSPDSIIDEFKNQDFEFTHENPETFESTMKAIASKSFDAYIFDYNLTSGTALFDAPAIASSIRGGNPTLHKDIPIILTSNKEPFSEYSRDFASQDLFDFAVEKDEFRTKASFYAAQIKSFIQAYQKIKTENFNIPKILGLSPSDYDKLDYRIKESYLQPNTQNDVYAIARFTNLELIQMTGVLIDENVLSARLGVSIDSSKPDWTNLKKELTDYQYKGILHDVFPRWWMDKIADWWVKEIDNSMPLKRLSATDRVEKIKAAKTDLTELQPIPLPKHAVSTRYWNACKDTQVALDTIDGLEISTRELKAWQDKEYISIEAGIDSKKPQQSHKKFLKPFSREKMNTIALKFNNDE